MRAVIAVLTAATCRRPKKRESRKQNNDGEITVK